MKIDIANTYWKRLIGLMFQRPTRGLWIPNCKQIHTFGMRFPLDVYAIDQDGNILSIQYQIKPNQIGMYHQHAYGILEVPSGTINVPIHQNIFSLLQQHDKQPERRK